MNKFHVFLNKIDECVMRKGYYAQNLNSTFEDIVIQPWILYVKMWNCHFRGVWIQGEKLKLSTFCCNKFLSVTLFSLYKLRSSSSDVIHSFEALQLLSWRGRCRFWNRTISYFEGARVNRCSSLLMLVKLYLQILFIIEMLIDIIWFFLKKNCICCLYDCFTFIIVFFVILVKRRLYISIELR